MSNTKIVIGGTYRLDIAGERPIIGCVAHTGGRDCLAIVERIHGRRTCFTNIVTFDIADVADVANHVITLGGTA